MFPSSAQGFEVPSPPPVETPTMIRRLVSERGGPEGVGGIRRLEVSGGPYSLRRSLVLHRRRGQGRDSVERPEVSHHVCSSTSPVVPSFAPTSSTLPYPRPGPVRLVLSRLSVDSCPPSLPSLRGATSPLLEPERPVFRVQNRCREDGE